MMNIQQLSDKMEQLVDAKGWSDPNSPRQQTPRNLAISLSLEASEVLEHFQWHDQITDRNALAGELADVALYLFQLARISQIDLEKAVLEKIQVNYGRTWENK